MPLLLPLLLLFVVIVVGIAITAGLVRLALMLFVAGFVGWLADLIVPGRLPYGWLGAILAGLVGGWLGHLLIGPVGPSFFGVRFVPALLGAIILALIVNALAKGATDRRGL